jgi:hypothetical protein
MDASQTQILVDPVVLIRMTLRTYVKSLDVWDSTIKKLLL